MSFEGAKMLEFIQNQKPDEAPSITYTDCE